MARLNILRLPRAVASEAPERAAEPEPVATARTLCFDCTWSHAVEGHVPGDAYVLCGLNGVLRDLPFAIARCTDYRERSARKDARVGFGAGV